MTPYFLAQISPHPMQGGDRYQSYLPFTLANDTSSFSFPILLSNPQDQGVSGRDHHPQQQLLVQQAPFEPSMISGSSDQPTNFPINTNNGNIVEPSFFADPYVREEDHRGSGKWMSSKMRVMQKMMNPDGIVTNKPRKKSEVHLDQQQPSQQDGITKDNMINGSPCGIIRVCSDCNTTKTPLWRSGPRGPKSLCNACGIRQRKARRAMAAASLNGGLPPTDKRSKARKEKNSEIDRSIPFKKRYKIATAGDQTAKKTLLFDDITISLSKDSAFPRVFQQDERDAAILLMALSCGLVRS